MNNQKRGFTLIELLVVIAIIGILASVILASLSSARAKGTDAAVKEDLDNARAQAELYYSSQRPNSYASVCNAFAATNGIRTIISDAAAKNGTAFDNAAGDAGLLTKTSCHDSATAWAASTPLKSVAGSYFCVDSSGAAKITTNALTGSGAGQFACL